MNIEFDIDDERLRKQIEVSVRDYVMDNRMISSLCRQAIYQLTAEAAQKIIKESPELLTKLVMEELTQVLVEQQTRSW